MKQAYDHIAASYDDEFTFSETGKLQRKYVISYLKEFIFRGKTLDILEVNCGTGEDALLFASLGHRVFATDASGEMIRVAKEKLAENESGNPEFHQLSFREIHTLPADRKFDLVFSNFGGLNHIDGKSLELFFQEVENYLKPDGRFVGVILPKFCLWEIIYFVYRFKWNQVFRRLRKDGTYAILKGLPVKVWYYSPGKIRRLAAGYQVLDLKPIGIGLPPSWMEKFFKNKKILLKVLDVFERTGNRFPMFTAISDHFLFSLKLKNN